MRVRVWFPEHRQFGTQQTLTSAWAAKGSRPTFVRQIGWRGIWVFGIVEPVIGWSMVSPYREVSAATMQQFVYGAAEKCGARQHTVMVLDRAGWHAAKQRKWPRRMMPLLLPPYSTEVNPGGRLWLWCGDTTRAIAFAQTSRRSRRRRKGVIASVIQQNPVHSA